MCEIHVYYKRDVLPDWFFLFLELCTTIIYTFSISHQNLYQTHFRKNVT